MFLGLGQLPSLPFHISQHHKMNYALAHVNTAATDLANNNSSERLKVRRYNIGLVRGARAVQPDRSISANIIIVLLPLFYSGTVHCPDLCLF